MSKTKTETPKAEIVGIPNIAKKRMKIRLIGDSPLVCHRWSEKAKRQMLDKQMKKAKQGKDAKDPRADYLDSLYWLSERPTAPTDKDIAKAKFGFPAIAFKQAAVDACTQIDGIAKTFARGAFHVEGEFVEIIGTPRMREDMVRIQMTSDIRYRGEFPEWSAELIIVYNENAISAEQILNLFNVAGFAVGIGEGRPQKDRDWGRFHVEAA